MVVERGCNPKKNRGKHAEISSASGSCWILIRFFMKTPSIFRLKNFPREVEARNHQLKCCPILQAVIFGRWIIFPSTSIFGVKKCWFLGRILSTLAGGNSNISGIFTPKLGEDSLAKKNTNCRFLLGGETLRRNKNFRGTIGDITMPNKDL